MLICFDISRPETLDSVLKKVGAWGHRETSEGTGHMTQEEGIMACPSDGSWLELASLYSICKSVLGAGNGIWGDETRAAYLPSLSPWLWKPWMEGLGMPVLGLWKALWPLSRPSFP